MQALLEHCLAVFQLLLGGCDVLVLWSAHFLALLGPPCTAVIVVECPITPDALGDRFIEVNEGGEEHLAVLDSGLGLDEV